MPLSFLWPGIYYDVGKRPTAATDLGRCASWYAAVAGLLACGLAPVLAAAVNSPVVMGRRLWQETRVALFQQSVDERSELQLRRGRRPRVNFGDNWIRESVLAIFLDVQDSSSIGNGVGSQNFSIFRFLTDCAS